MFGKMKELLYKHRHVVIYLLFGLLTTTVNYLVYIPMWHLAGLPAWLCNISAWCAAVIVAFVTNKPYVFESHDWSFRVTATEFVKFFSSRLISGLMETAIIFITVDNMGFNGIVMKLLTSAVVLVINYITSKFIVFPSDKKKESE